MLKTKHYIREQIICHTHYGYEKHFTRPYITYDGF